MSKFKNFFAKIFGWIKKAVISACKEIKYFFVKNGDKRSGLVSLLSKPSAKPIYAAFLSIGIGLIIGFVFLVIVSFAEERIEFVDSFLGLFVIMRGAFVDQVQFGNMLFRATPILLTGLSVAIAFKTGLFNIGASGQYLAGTTVTLLIALSIPSTPQTAFWIWLLALMAGMAAGAVWGAVPGIFKAYLNVNEVITCIMMNWIAASATSWTFSNSPLRNIAETKTFLIKKTMSNGIKTPSFGLDMLFPNSQADGGIIIAILLAIVVMIILNKTTFGYELRSCGFNKNASRYAGMNEKRNIVFSMAIAGALAAAGASLYWLQGGTEFSWETYMDLPAEGFNGIPVALLASSNPIGVIFSALFMSYIGIGGYQLTIATNYNEHITSIVVAVIVYCTALSAMFIAFFNKRGKNNKLKAELASKNSVSVGDGPTETVDKIVVQFADVEDVTNSNTHEEEK